MKKKFDILHSDLIKQRDKKITDFNLILTQSLTNDKYIKEQAEKYVSEIVRLNDRIYILEMLIK